MADNNNDLIDVDESRLMAALCYVGILILVPILKRKNDPFVYFHIKQGMVVLAIIILSVLAAAWISIVGNILFLIIISIDIIALVQALLGKRWRIPLLGNLAEKFEI